MKALIVLLFVGVNFFACDFRSLSQKETSANEMVTPSSTPKIKECEKTDYKHKSEAEIAAMTPAQWIDEMVSEQLYHMPAFEDETADLLGDYIYKEGVKILPLLIEYLNDYDPKGSSDCDRSGMRFAISSAYADSLDNTIFRLRGTTEGRLAIEALGRGVGRMREAGFEKSDHKFNGRFNLSLHHLEMAKGTNIRDEMIRATLRARHGVQMTESEYLDFSNFLTSLDPAYPTWSDVGEYGPPPLMAESKRYYEAYLKFKARK